jgi:hypothetical protein
LVAQPAHGNIFIRDTCIGASDCTEKTSSVDLAADGDAPNAAAGKHVAMSADGRFVVFESKATNLVPGLQNGSPVASSSATSLYVRDLCAGASAPSGCVQHTDALSVNVAGELASGGDSGFASVSVDGRFVAFVSSAANLVAGQKASGTLIFVRDTCAGPTAGKSCVARTEELPIDEKYLTSRSQGAGPAISANGRYVAFVVWGGNSASGRRSSQVLLRDTCMGSDIPASCAPATTEISVSSGDEPGDAQSSAPSVSGDGRFVVFQSNASSLVTEGAKSKTNVFLRDTCLGATAPDGCTPSTTLIGAQSAGVATDSDAFAPWISASGRYISFISGVSTSAKRQHFVETYLFVRDTCVGATTSCIARTITVAAPVNGSQVTTLRVDQFLPVPVIANGRVAAFSSTSPIPAAPTSGYGDVLLTLTSF